MNKIIIVIAFLILFVVMLGGFGYLYFSAPRFAYVENEKLYEDFTLKKELEAKLENIKQMRKSDLDSLLLKMQVLSQVIRNGKEPDNEREKQFEMLRSEYLIKEKQNDEDNENLAQQYSSQIWKQINQFVNDYGKQHNYDFIYGASGNGTLMHANTKLNITSEVVKFINERYKGEK